MLVWSIPLSIAASTTAITALKEREAGAAAGHAAARAADYAPEDREDNESADDNCDDDGPPETNIRME
jgi:hypothetical protein